MYIVLFLLIPVVLYNNAHEWLHQVLQTFKRVPDSYEIEDKH